jgi:phage-related protein
MPIIIDEFTSVNLKQLGLTCLSFQVEPLEAEHETESVEGADGYTDIETTYNGRKLYSRWFFRVGEYGDFHDIKDKIYRLFAPKKELVLIDERQPFKQWHARVEAQDRIDNDKSPMWKEFEVNFISKHVYAAAVDLYNETFTTNAFTVFNAGTETIDAREHELLITFKGTSDKLRIVNNSTGDQWQYFGTTSANDTIKLDQVYPYKNGSNIFGNTNHGAITILPSSNNFSVFGASGSYSIKFEFRPMYI